MQSSSLGRTGRISLAIFTAALLLSQVAAPIVFSGSGVLTPETIRFVASAIFDHPVLVRDIGAQVLVVVLLHLLLIWLVAVLARPRKPPARPYEQPVLTVWITGLALCWLILDWHNRIFPNSLWVDLFDPASAPVAAMAADALAALWLVQRLVRFATAKVQDLRSFDRSRGSWAVVVLFSIATFAVLLTEHLPATATQRSETGSRRPPNIIVIGLDSVRRESLISATSDHLPTLAALRDGSFAQINMVTPLGRSFSAWASLLTGKLPREIGATDDLVPLKDVDTSSSFAKVLQAHGYRTVFATDESRFSNVGHEFGFDEVVSPKWGIGDIALAKAGDLPLVNFAVQIPRSEWLLPSLAANRAMATGYFPSRFVRRLQDALGPNPGDRPTLIAMHLCVSHWPFFTAERIEVEEGDEALYHVSIRTLDRQLRLLLDMLKTRGYLDDNTLVVVTPDHGEGLRIDRLTPPVMEQHGFSGPFDLSFGGHGATLLAREQWQIFTLFYGSGAEGPIKPGVSAQLGGLDDVGPAILELAGFEAPTRNRLEVVTHNSNVFRQPTPPRKTVSMETGFRPKDFDPTNPDMGRAAQIAMERFQVMDDGRYEMKPESVRLALEDRDYGVTDGYRSLIYAKLNLDYLVYYDGVSDRLDIYPAQRGPEQPLLTTPLLESACSDLEMRSKIPSWCVGDR